MISRARDQLILISEINWYWLVLANRWSIASHMKPVHHLPSIGKTSRTQFLNTLHQYPVACALKFTTCNVGHVDKVWVTRSSTLHKGHRESLPPLPDRSEVNIGKLFTACKKRETQKHMINDHAQLGHLQSELVDLHFWHYCLIYYFATTYTAVGKFIVCQCKTSVT